MPKAAKLLVASPGKMGEAIHRRSREQWSRYPEGPDQVASVDPKALRKRARVPMHMVIGLDLGLAIAESYFSQLPVRRVMRPGQGVPLGEHIVCVGLGHHPHRQPASQWASPLVPGWHGL